MDLVEKIVSNFCKVCTICLATDNSGFIIQSSALPCTSRDRCSAQTQDEREVLYNDDDYVDCTRNARRLKNNISKIPT